MAARQNLNDLNNNRVLNRTLVIHTLPGLMIFFALLLAFVLLLLIFSLITGLHLGSLLVHPNPLAAYESLWPGQPVTSVNEYARRTPSGSFRCYAGSELPEGDLSQYVVVITANYGATDHRLVCMNQFHDGIFQSMTVTVIGSQIQELDLFSEALQEDSLLLYWGVPDAMTLGGNSQYLYLHWNRSTYSAVAMIRQPGTIVKMVTLTANH